MQLQDFYPRSPCGERLSKKTRAAIRKLFLSTLSLRRATAEIRAEMKAEMISIHALLAESDVLVFYSLAHRVISIHALLAESDPPGSTPGRATKISIHALLAESDTDAQSLAVTTVISIHALLAESDWRG